MQCVILDLGKKGYTGHFKTVGKIGIWSIN